MKTMISVLGLFALAGAVALAQTSSAGSTSSQTATQGSSPKSGVQAENSGFDTDSTSPPNQATGSSSGSMGSQASSGTSTSSSSGQSSYGTPPASQSGASDSIVNGPVAETVTDSSALIGWATRDSASGSAVKYGTSRSGMVQSADASDGSDGKNHHAKLQGLSPNTRYYFQVTQNGQPVGGVGTFKTTATGEQPVQSKATIPQK
jgi:hypothetical protein